MKIGKEIRGADKSLQFCPHCGAGVGEWEREGEAKCVDCPTPVIYNEHYKEKQETNTG